MKNIGRGELSKSAGSKASEAEEGKANITAKDGEHPREMKDMVSITTKTIIMPTGRELHVNQGRIL